MFLNAMIVHLLRIVLFSRLLLMVNGNYCSMIKSITKTKNFELYFKHSDQMVTNTLGRLSQLQVLLHIDYINVITCTVLQSTLAHKLRSTNKYCNVRVSKATGWLELAAFGLREKPRRFANLVNPGTVQIQTLQKISSCSKLAGSISNQCDGFGLNHYVGSGSYNQI